MNYIKKLNNEKEEIDWNAMFTTPHMTVPSDETTAEWQRCVDAGRTLTCAHEVGFTGSIFAVVKI